MNRLAVLFAVSFLPMFAGCSTNYKLAAIKEARLYALEQNPDFSEEDIHQVKFTKPEVQQKTLFKEESTGSGRDLTQTCFVWKLNDRAGKSLIIAGVAQRNLKDWYPIRSIIRRYRKIGGDDGKSNATAHKVARDAVRRRKINRLKRASR